MATEQCPHLNLVLLLTLLRLTAVASASNAQSQKFTFEVVFSLTQLTGKFPVWISSGMQNNSSISIYVLPNGSHYFLRLIVLANTSVCNMLHKLLRLPLGSFALMSALMFTFPRWVKTNDVSGY